MKVGVVGSRNYMNSRKIKDFLSMLKKKFGDDLIVISAGTKTGAEPVIRKNSIAFGINFKEYNPAHTARTLYSAMPEGYYGKPYHASQFAHRNMLLAKEVDVLVVFKSIGDKDTIYDSTIKQVQKLNKPVTIIT